MNDIYEAIFSRMSVRKFKKEKLNGETLETVERLFGELKPLDESIKTRLEISTDSRVSGLFSIKAPHYLLFFSEEKPGYLPNAGFMLQQMDLRLSAMGIGACWLGFAKPSGEAPKASSLEFVITLAFGEAVGEVHRKDRSQFRRKEITEICRGDQHLDLIEAARLAPSATNSQPWFFVSKREKIDLYCVKPGFIKTLFYKRLNEIDSGIALLHLFVAAERAGLAPKIVIDRDAMDNPPEGYYYVRSIEVER